MAPKTCTNDDVAITSKTNVRIEDAAPQQAERFVGRPTSSAEGAGIDAGCRFVSWLPTPAIARRIGVR